MESSKPETVKPVPWQIWATITILIGLGLVNIINYPRNDCMYFHFVIRMIVSFGLLYKRKWAFITIIVLGVIHILVFLLMKEVVMSLANLIFTLLIASAYRFFSPNSEIDVMPCIEQHIKEEKQL